ncbi:hypothetical protein BDR07DRAFT_278132 [Suillus spraguei]|nr:hypothetical protein BDR07DRAFT_278132 [Suillus spraguei]
MVQLYFEFHPLWTKQVFSSFAITFVVIRILHHTTTSATRSLTSGEHYRRYRDTSSRVSCNTIYHGINSPYAWAAKKPSEIDASSFTKVPIPIIMYQALHDLFFF